MLKTWDEIGNKNSGMVVVLGQLLFAGDIFNMDPFKSIGFMGTYKD